MYNVDLTSSVAEAEQDALAPEQDQMQGRLKSDS